MVKPESEKGCHPEINLPQSRVSSLKELIQQHNIPLPPRYSVGAGLHLHHSAPTPWIFVQPAFIEKRIICEEEIINPSPRKNPNKSKTKKALAKAQAKAKAKAKWDKVEVLGNWTHNLDTRHIG